MTRAIDRLIVSGSIDPARARTRRRRSAGCSTGSTRGELDDAAAAPLELERDGARVLVRVDRFTRRSRAGRAPSRRRSEQLALFAVAENGAAAPDAPSSPPLAEVPAPPLHRVRRLSYSALALFERCSYRFYAERVVGLRPADAAGTRAGPDGPRRDRDRRRRARAARARRPARAAPCPTISPSSCAPATRPRPTRSSSGSAASSRRTAGRSSARALAALEGATAERPFAFEHDGVLLHGRLDVLHRDGGARARRSTTRRTRSPRATPAEIVEARLPAAAARLRARLLPRRRGGGRGRLPVPRAPGRGRRDDVHASSDVPALEAELSAAIARIQAGEFRPTPSEFACADCPALDVVCAGPRLRARRADGPQLRPRGAPARRPEARADRADHRAAAAPSTRTRRSRSAFRTDLELLVSVMLSAQTTDVNVNRVTETALREVPHARGLPRRPARGARARHLRDRLLPPEGEGAPRDDGDADRGATTAQVPRTARGARCGCPGVARKTANVVAAELGEPQGIVVDTHVRRLSQRLGLTRQEDPVKIERDLIKLVPREDWGVFPHLLIWHGRRVCLARSAALRGVRAERPLSFESRRSRPQSRSHARA